jgi:hypothetical protein
MVAGRQRDRVTQVTLLSSPGAQSMDIREHMEIVDSEDKHIGTVEGERIKLTRTDSPDGSTTSSTRSRSPPWRATR